MVSEEQVLVYNCRCRFCNHGWRSFSIPDRCAGCKRPGWNKDDSRAETKPKEGVDVAPLYSEDYPPERELISLDDILNWEPKKGK